MSERPPPPLPPSAVAPTRTSSTASKRPVRSGVTPTTIAAFPSARETIATTPEPMRRLAQNTLFFGEVRFGSGTGQGFDAAHARSDRHFADDLEDPDVAGAADMRTAAELDREGPVVVVCFAHRDDPHLVAVLFAKERERTLGDGAIGCQQAGAYCGVRADAPVDLRLDRLDILARHRSRM